MTAAVLVMAKAPRPGLAKTRLQPALGIAGCAALQAALIRHTATTALAAAPTYVAVTPADAQAEVASLLPAQATVLAQCDGDLGQRMNAAVRTVHECCGGPVVVVGTDAATLTTADLRQALAAVVPGRVVLGPAADGGYYLIGLPEPAPAVFDIPPQLWSGPQVLVATVRAAVNAAYASHLLRPLRDLDTPDDLAALRTDPALPPAISTLLSDRRPAWTSA